MPNHLLQSTAHPPLDPRVLRLLGWSLVLAWGGVVLGSFQYDDFANVLTDPATTQAPQLIDRLFGGIRPLTRLSYALCARLFGEWAGGWLLVQWLLHVGVVIGVIRLAQWRTGSAMAAFIAGACFALLPSHASVIAYVSGRSTGLATALLVAALVFHELAQRSDRRRLHQALAIMAFLLACTARETALIFPLLVLLWEGTRSPHVSWADGARRTAPYLICAAAVAVLSLAFVPRYLQLLEFSFALRSPLESLTHNLAALPASLSLGLRPWALSVEHVAPTDTASMVIGALVLSAMIGAGMWFRVRRPLIALALLWPIVALLPTHSLIAKLDPITEGPLYLALIGPAIAFGGYASHWLRDASARIARPVLTTAALTAVGLCAWRTVVWGDPVALWEEATVRAPVSSRAWTNLGMAHFAAGHHARARQAFATALDLDPSNVRVMLNLEAIAALDTNTNVLEPREQP